MIKQYAKLLQSTLESYDWSIVEEFCRDVELAWKNGQQLFLCGNGGSAANALHIANDLTYGIAPPNGVGMRVNALPANVSVLTCLANDIGYENIFSYQLEIQAQPGDVLLVLSGSGNSPNVVKALEVAKKKGVKTWAILGYTGGKCLKAADKSIYFPVNDMQIAEDTQLVVGHMLMKWLKKGAC